MKKIFVLFLVVACLSGCYYIRQDWDMYSNQPHAIMDAGADK